jgi:hypothetical protein
MFVISWLLGIRSMFPCQTQTSTVRRKVKGSEWRMKVCCCILSIWYGVPLWCWEKFEPSAELFLVYLKYPLMFRLLPLYLYFSEMLNSAIKCLGTWWWILPHSAHRKDPWIFAWRWRLYTCLSVCLNTVCQYIHAKISFCGFKSSKLISSQP